MANAAAWHSPAAAPPAGLGREVCRTLRLAGGQTTSAHQVQLVTAVRAKAALRRAVPQVGDGVTRVLMPGEQQPTLPEWSAGRQTSRLHACAKCIWSRTWGLSFPLKTKYTDGLLLETRKETENTSPPPQPFSLSERGKILFYTIRCCI